MFRYPNKFRVINNIALYGLGNYLLAIADGNELASGTGLVLTILGGVPLVIRGHKLIRNFLDKNEWKEAMVYDQYGRGVATTRYRMR